MTEVTLLTVGVVMFAGVVALVRHVHCEQRTFDTDLARRSVAHIAPPPVESAREYVPIYELEF